MDFNIDEWDKLSYIQKLKYQETSPVDCSFVIGTGTNAKTIRAHKAILVRSSTVFETMFNGRFKEAESTFNIPLPNVLNYLDFITILKYIYYKKPDVLEVLNMERLKHVAYLAHYYMLDSFLTECHRKICEKVAESNFSFCDFVQAFEYEKKLDRKITGYYNSRQFMKLSDRFPYTSTELLTNASIYDLEPIYFYDLLKVLVSTFKASECFCLIENYAKLHGLKMGKLAFQNIQDHDNGMETGKTLVEMFELIEFRKMTANEFKLGPAVSKIWTISPEEKLQILLYLK